MLSWITDSALTIITFIVVFSIVVVIHELGHFLVARYHGVKVLEFGFGMPPRLWGFQKGDTLFSINALPIGGFVRTHGQNDFGSAEYDANDTENYQNKTVWQRMQIIIAGVLMNALLAVVLLTAGYSIGMAPLLESTPGFQDALDEQGVVVTEIIADGAAVNSGIAVDDRVIMADEFVIDNYEAFSQYTATHAGETIMLTVLRDEAEISIPVVPDVQSGRVGIVIYTLREIQSVQFPIHRAFAAAVSDSYHIGALTLTGVGGMLLNIITTFSLSEDIAGPIGIVSITHDVVQMGFSRVVQLAAVLSVTLAVINVMPFPGLDGGHLLFTIIEGIRGKRVSPRLEARVHLFGFMLLLLLLIVVSIQDVQRLFGG